MLLVYDHFIDVYSYSAGTSKVDLSAVRVNYQARWIYCQTRYKKEQRDFEINSFQPGRV